MCAIQSMSFTALNVDCTESLQQGAQDGAFTIKGDVLPLEEGSCIDEWIMVDVLVMNIPEEGSGRRQDNTVCVGGCQSFKTRVTSVNAAPGGQSQPFSATTETFTAMEDRGAINVQEE